MLCQGTMQNILLMLLQAGRLKDRALDMTTDVSPGRSEGLKCCPTIRPIRELIGFAGLKN